MKDLNMEVMDMLYNTLDLLDRAADFVPGADPLCDELARFYQRPVIVAMRAINADVRRQALQPAPGPARPRYPCRPAHRDGRGGAGGNKPML